MSISVKKWFVRCVSFILMSASFTVTSASCVELTRSLENDSPLYLQLTNRDQVEDVSSNRLSYVTEAMQSLFVLAKSGVVAVRKNPLKALTIFLALQNKNSVIKIPGAEAIVATNINQNLTYVIDGPAVNLLPISIGGGSSPCNATIELRNVTSGSLTSVGTKLPQKFSAGVWKAQGTRTDINTLLYNLTFTPARGYRETIYLDPTILDVLPTNASATQYERILEITRQALATVHGVIQIDVFMTTTSAATPSSTASLATESTSDSDQNGTDSVTNESLVFSPTLSLIIIDSSSISLIIPASKPPYEVIVGATVGVAFSCGILATIVAYMRGWCGMQKKSSTTNSHDRELGVHPPASNALGKGCYSNIPALGPQVSNQNTYQDLPIKSHYESHLLKVQDSEDIYSNLEKAVLGGACDLIDVFLDLGVPVDSVNDQGFTPLHLSVQAGEEDACKLLLRRGADKSLVTKDGKTALVLAQELGHTHLVALLENS